MNQEASQCWRSSGWASAAEFIPIYQQHPGAHMYAICQRNAERLQKIGDTFGVQQRYTRYDDVLADANVDFVHVNSPIPGLSYFVPWDCE